MSLEAAFQTAVVFSAVDHFTSGILPMVRSMGQLDSSIKTQQKNIQDYQKKISDLPKAYEGKTKQAIDDYNQKIQKQQDISANTSKSIEEYKKKIEDVQKTIGNKVNKSIEEYNKKIETQKTSSAAAAKEIEKYQKQIEALNLVSDKGSEKSIEQYNKKVSSLQGIVDKNAQSIEKYSGKIKDTSQKMDAASQKSIEQYKQKIDKLEQSVGKSTKEIDAYKTAIADLPSAMGTKQQAEIDEYRKKIDDTTLSLKEMKATQKMESGRKTTAAGAVIEGVGTTMENAFDKSSDKAKELETNLASLQIATGSSATEMKKYQDAAIDISLPTIYSQSQVVKHEQILAAGGISDLERLKAATKISTNLAEVTQLQTHGQVSPEETVKAFLGMAHQFNLQTPEQLDVFSNQLAKIQLTSTAKIPQMSETLKYLAPYMNLLGGTPDDALKSTALMSRMGIEGSAAGTHLKDFYERLTPGLLRGGVANDEMYKLGWLKDAKVKQSGGPSTAKITELQNKINTLQSNQWYKFDPTMQANVKKYSDQIAKEQSKAPGTEKVVSWSGDIFHDKSGAVLPFTEIMKELVRTTKENNLQFQDLLKPMVHIFGQQGADVAAILSSQTGIESLDKIMSSTSSMPGLEEQIKKYRGTYEGQQEVMKSNFENVNTQYGQDLNEFRMKFLVPFNEVLANILTFTREHPDLVGGIAVAGQAIAAVALIAGPITMFVGTLKGLSAIKDLTAVMKAAQAATEGATAVATAGEEAAIATEGMAGTVTTVGTTIASTFKAIAATLGGLAPVVLLAAAAPFVAAKVAWSEIDKRQEDDKNAIAKHEQANEFSRKADLAKGGTTGEYRLTSDSRNQSDVIYVSAAQVAMEEAAEKAKQIEKYKSMQNDTLSQGYDKRSPIEKAYGAITSILPHHATGGIFGTAHIAEVAEDGEEGIIPLSPKYRDRALSLYADVGNRLGVNGGGGNITVAPGAIVINPAPSQSPDQIADAVIRKLGRKARDQSMSRPSSPITAW